MHTLLGSAHNYVQDSRVYIKLSIFLYILPRYLCIHWEINQFDLRLIPLNHLIYIIIVESPHFMVSFLPVWKCTRYHLLFTQGIRLSLFSFGEVSALLTVIPRKTEHKEHRHAAW